LSPGEESVKVCREPDGKDKGRVEEMSVEGTPVNLHVTLAEAGRVKSTPVGITPPATRRGLKEAAFLSTVKER